MTPLKSRLGYADPRPMKSLKLLGITFFSYFLLTNNVRAEVMRWPQACLQGQLRLQNQTAAEVKVWLQKFDSDLQGETEYLIPGKSSLGINITAIKTSEHFSVLHFQRPKGIEAVFSCRKKNYPAHTFEGGILTYRRTDLIQNQLWIQNLYSAKNDFKITYLDSRRQELKTVSLVLASAEKTIYETSAFIKNWQYLRIEAHDRFAAFNINSHGSEGPFLIETQKTARAPAAYFVVGPQDHTGDSFITKITNPAMIAKAREQISNPALQKILFAKIQKGHGDFNRNWSKQEKSFWSWSTSEVTNIADIGSTACNGLPQAVEDRTNSWLTEPGNICFWSYRIQKELTPEQVAAGEIIR